MHDATADSLPRIILSEIHNTDHSLKPNKDLNSVEAQN
jgi:hypothetical protein